MIKAILIDDEPLSREILKRYLIHFPQIEMLSHTLPANRDR